MRAILVILLVTFSIVAIDVILDPGHGGTDSGATGPSYLEKQANLDVAFFAKSYLESAGVTVGMTRSTDVYISLTDRTTMANSGGWDRFMSIHENAINSAVQGTETFCYPSGSAESFDLRNKVHPELIWAHGYYDRGTKTADFHVLRETSMPAILGEGTFIDYTAGWDESWRYLTNWNDHSGRQGFAYSRGYCIHRGITPPTYGDPPPSDSIIVNDSDPEFTLGGTWVIGTYPNGWDGDYYWCNPTGDNWARWTPNLPEDGEYSVYMWWPAGENRCDSVFIRVFGTSNDSLFVSQKGIAGGEWHYLGNHDFLAGTSGYVSLGDRTAVNGTAVIADAVLWIHNGPLDVTERISTPSALSLSVYPNPFNSAVTIAINGVEAGITPARVEIFDLAGRRVAELPSPSVPLPEGEGGDSFSFVEKGDKGRMRAEFTWTPNDKLPSGIYLVRAGFGQRAITRRVVYLK